MFYKIFWYKLIIKLCGQFTFNTTLYLRYSLQSLKHHFLISNVLAHWFFCRSRNSNEGNCRSCSRLFVNDASNFVSSIRYHFTLFPTSNVFNKELELLFAEANLRYFTLDLFYQSGTHYTPVDSDHNRCMFFLVAKQPCDLAVKLSEVWIRILINDIASISSDFLINGKYCLSSRKEKRALFLDSWVQFVKCFYFDACKLLYANAFVFVCEKFESSIHDCANTLEIVNKCYLDYCTRKYSR